MAARRRKNGTAPPPRRERSTIPPQTRALLIEVHAEFEGLVARDFIGKLRRLRACCDDLPPLARDGVRDVGSAFTLFLHDEAQRVRHIVDFLGLTEAAQGEAWLRRQLDGLGEKGGA